MTELTKHLINYRKCLLNRDFLLDLFTITDKEAVVKENAGYVLYRNLEPYVGKFVTLDGKLFYITNYTAMEKAKWAVAISPLEGIRQKKNKPLISPNDRIDITIGDIENYNVRDTLTTTCGRFAMNYIVLAHPFGNIVPYIDDKWVPQKIYDLIYEALISKKISLVQYNTFVKCNYYIGQFTELAVPAFTRKSLTTSPDIENRRKELFEIHADAIAAKDPIVMSNIEKELIGMDRAYLSGDPSERYLLSKKAFDVQRKKLLVTTGMVETFGTPGDYSFVETPLSEGWKIKDLPVLINETRAGSYGRAKETAVGGEESKFLMRIFQNSRITEDDCKTKRTLKIEITDYNYAAYEYRYVVDGSATIETDKSYLQKKIGKTISLRSPQMCETKDGYCFTCMGGVFKTLNQKALGMTAVAIGSYFLTERMKGMHGKSVSTLNVDNLDKYTY
jgi:hypothetical protein